jgi:dihydroflavonol-4-reductase
MKTYPSTVEAIDTDFHNPEELRKHCAGAVAVVHAAGLVSYDRKDQALMYETHVELTKRMLEAAQAAKVRRFVHVSSIVTIGHGREPRDESSSYNAAELGLAYWDTKTEAERVALSANRPGFEVISVNPGSLLGEGEKGGQLGRFLKKLVRIKRPVLPDGGSDFLDVKDGAQGTVLALEKGRPGERYILGAENLTYVQLHARLRLAAGAGAGSSKPFQMPGPLLSFATEAIRALERVTPIDLPINAARLRRVNGVFMFHDISKAKRELGFSPVPIDRALRAMLEE